MKMVEVFDESTNKLVGKVPYYSGEEMEAIVDKAVAAQPKWENVPTYERSRILYKWCDLITEHSEELAIALSENMGKQIACARAEAAYSADIARGNIEVGKHIYGETFPDNTEGYESHLVFTRREALGVIAAIIPFNYPLELTVQKAAPALMMGNSVIVKASSKSPVPVYKLVQLAHEAGVPEDAIQFVCGDRDDCTQHILRNPKVACLAFTGSTAAGTDMINNSADTIKKVIIELGGNDAFIVREDVATDPEYLKIAVTEIMFGRINENMGQVCACPKRIIVHRKAKDIIAKALMAAIKDMKIGHATEEGAQITRLVDSAAAKKVEQQIKHTVDQGATILCGGTREGARIMPTILDNVTPDMDVAKDMEIFGPVLPLITFDTDEEAIRIANNSKYGLSSAIISRDMKTALGMAEKIEAAAVVINGASAYRHNDAPFGGCKASGLGNEGALTSCEEFSRFKTYYICDLFEREAVEKEGSLNVYFDALYDQLDGTISKVIDEELK